jgi:7-carboxy-7-deazaguanine synthase (Cx14CxxC type)
VTYAVKEIFYTLQGEGANAGRPAVFCRFAGCNLWSGREEDRASAVCTFCDTDFVGTDGSGGGKFVDAEALAEAVATHWPAGDAQHRFVVCTGGEPALQLDDGLVAALHARGFAIAIETNGTLPLPEGIDWVCVSPKSDAAIVVTRGDELKLVYPQPRALPERFAGLAFDHFLIQPMDGLPGDATTRARHTERAVEYCLSHPQWRLSMQTHKLLGIR